MGLNVEKIKKLTPEELEKLANEAKDSSEKSNDKVNSKKNKTKLDIKDTPKLIESIKKASEKIFSVCKSLENAGYSISSTIKCNLESGLKMLNLLDEILKISVSNGTDISNQKYHDLKKVVDKFNRENLAIRVSLGESSYYNSKIEAKKCIKILLINVEKYFESIYEEFKTNGDDQYTESLATK